MTEQRISSRNLERISNQLRAEELLLDKFQTTLTALNTNDSIIGFMNIHPAGQTELNDLMKSIHELSETRSKLRVELADEFSLQASNLLQQKIARTRGKLKATVSNLILKRQIVEASLFAMGIPTKQERYNAAGEKLNEQATSQIETRS